jgi:hypothetical protein
MRTQFTRSNSMSSRTRVPARPVGVTGARRGSALFLVLVLTMAVSALAMSAIVLTAHTTLISKYFQRERDFKYAAESALAMAKSRLANDPDALPDTGYVQLMSGGSITGADGNPIPGVKVDLYVGPTGSTSGQFGRFASVVADARDASGSRFVRRLELAQESFAKFAYWTNHESNNGAPIYFAGGDALFGPVWSNDDIHILNTGAKFFDDVGTAGVIQGKQYGTFAKPPQENIKPITMPTNTTLANLSGYAAAGQLAFDAPTAGNESTVRMRLEFVATDLNGTNDSTDVDEGFVRVYVANFGQTAWLRGDYNADNCGDWHDDGSGRLKFYPASVHSTGNAWFTSQLQAGGMSSNGARNEARKTLSQVMQGANARCYLGGDPHLVAIDRAGAAGYSTSDWQKGGEDTTFTPTGVRGGWIQWTGPVDARVAARRPADASYLFPLYRGLNSGVKGVVYVNGTAAVSGVLRARMTLYATGDVVFVDDLRYATDPASKRCRDMLGIIAGHDAVVADNGINTPQAAGVWRSFDDNSDTYIQAVIMALNTSFRVENYAGGPTSAVRCETSPLWGRGCLYLTGGLIQEARGPVGTSAGTGYIKRYSYDRCVLSTPPPYFPTTGRFEDNRYYEIDPVRFDVAKLFKSLVPQP